MAVTRPNPAGGQIITNPGGSKDSGTTTYTMLGVPGEFPDGKTQQTVTTGEEPKKPTILSSK